MADVSRYCCGIETIQQSVSSSTSSQPFILFSGVCTQTSGTMYAIQRDLDKTQRVKLHPYGIIHVQLPTPLDGTSSSQFVVK